jgi:hypothetical protein
MDGDVSREPVKNDGGKPRFELIPAVALFAIAEALTYGAKKYEADNYRKGGGLAWRRIFGAINRHAWAWLGGEDLDPESGLNHLAHMGAGVVMLLELVLTGNGKDDRFRRG